MKTFLAVFFGILVAVAVIWVAIGLAARSERQAKIDRVQQATVALSFGCRNTAYGSPERQALEEEIQRGQEAFTDLDSPGDSAKRMIDVAALNNQVSANGCFQPDPPAQVKVSARGHSK